MSIIKFIWCLPNTIIGLIFGLLSLGIPNKLGVVESRWGFAWLLHKFGNIAICLGYVVIHYNKEGAILYADYTHELVHREQQCQWGIFFWLAYIIAGFIAVSEGKHFYWDNYFEIEAFRRQND